MKSLIIAATIVASTFLPQTNAAEYIIDSKGAHASINFKINHLGYSWLIGRFDTFSGKFNFDADNISSAKIEVLVDTSSINSNHSERDKHLKSDDFLDVNSFTSAKFISSSVKDKSNGKFDITGTLTLHGVSKEIVINAQKVGEGQDPWGGYRAGFSGTTRLSLKDFAIKMDLGPASSYVELNLFIEGIKQ